MQHVYTSSNPVEAHMIVHMLEQEGIKAFLHGEYLQGAIGELPANDFIKILVIDDDYENARTLIAEWEKTQPAPDYNPVKKNQDKAAPFLATLAAVFGVCFVIYQIYQHIAPDSEEKQHQPTYEIDRNGDDIIDDITYYDDPNNENASRYKVDANYDGTFDVLTQADSQGIPVSTKRDLNYDGIFDVFETYDNIGDVVSAKGDYDFDGILETKDLYEFGLMKQVDTDIDADGHIDIRDIFEHGSRVRTLYFDAETQKLIKVSHYNAYQIIFSELDTDKDGFFDTKYTYDQYEEIAKIIKDTKRSVNEEATR